jgi:hypothetical protein
MTAETEVELVVSADGVARCIYDDALDLREIGRLSITRASHVEPDVEGYWWADMGPVYGPVLGPYVTRTEALEAERGWLLGKSRQLLQKPTGLAEITLSPLKSTSQDSPAHMPAPGE